MKHESSEVVTPKPFFKIKFSCGGRSFYKVKSDLYDIAGKIGIEIQDGYITETCDYEGDLEKITIWNEERSKDLIQSVLSFYGISILDLPDGMDVVLALF